MAHKALICGLMAGTLCTLPYITCLGRDQR